MFPRVQSMVRFRGRSWIAVLGPACLLAAASAVQAQRPYIGFVYPAGGQQGTTFQIRLGGQNVDVVNDVQISGGGVQIKKIEALRRLNNDEMNLLREQLNELKRPTAPK